MPESVVVLARKREHQRACHYADAVDWRSQHRLQAVDGGRPDSVSGFTEREERGMEDSGHSERRTSRSRSTSTRWRETERAAPASTVGASKGPPLPNPLRRCRCHRSTRSCTLKLLKAITQEVTEEREKAASPARAPTSAEAE